MVRWTAFSPDWPSWLSEQQCHLVGLLGLIGHVNISVNWLAGWHGWVTFQLSWLHDLVKSPWVIGNLVLQVNTIVIWLAWLAKWTSLFMIWSGDQLHLVGLSGQVNTIVRGLVWWTAALPGWPGFPGEQLYMVSLVCSILMIGWSSEFYHSWNTLVPYIVQYVLYTRGLICSQFIGLGVCLFLRAGGGQPSC